MVSSVDPAIDNATPRLLPHTLPMPSTPPRGVDTQHEHSTRTGAARSNATYHATPLTCECSPTDGPTGVKPEGSELSKEEAAVHRSTDPGNGASVTGRF